MSPVSPPCVYRVWTKWPVEHICQVAGSTATIGSAGLREGAEGLGGSAGLAFYGLDDQRHLLVKGDAGAFIKEYESLYFDDSEVTFCRLRRSAQGVEREIERILTEGFGGEGDVKKVLAWKVGRVDHKRSSEDCFVYTREWEDPRPRTYRGKPFDFSLIAKKVLTVQEGGRADDPEALVGALTQDRIRGMGPVYLLTLLYFLTQGRCPIYDHYVALAINALHEGAAPGKRDARGRQHPLGKAAYDAVRPRDLFSGLRHVLEKGSVYPSFVERVEDIFGPEATSDALEYRRIDRALWVYGHRFTMGAARGCG